MAGDSVRIDKWLWAARFYKTRTAATAAVAGGTVSVGGVTAKPSRTVSPGDVINVRLAPFDHEVVVTGLAERRGSATDAAKLFEETPASLAERQKRAQQLRDAPQVRFEKGRPSKRDRRLIDKLKGR